MSAIADRDVALVDLIDRLFNGGIVIHGDVILAAADIDLVYVELRVLVSSVSTALEKGVLREIGDAF